MKRDDGGAVIGDFELHSQNCYGSQYCDKPSCWSNHGVLVITHPDKPDVALCRYHRKHWLEVSS